MIHLIYVSSAVSEMSDADLLFLLKQSRTRNQKQHITGMLLYINGTFIQVLEGAEKDVNDIYAAIVKDDRNTGNIVIKKEAISERAFPDWAMGFRQLNKDSIVNVAGYTEFLEQELNPTQIVKQSSIAIKLLDNFKKHNA